LGLAELIFRNRKEPPMNGKNWTRRQVLKGATGVAISLPWLETLAPRKAHAAGAVKRYIDVYFPNGTPNYWKPSGGGANWTLSPILQPLEPFKAKMSEISNIGNYSPFGGHIEPSHGHNCAAAFTGVRASVPGGAKTGNSDRHTNSGISVDQVIANQMVAANGGKLPTPLHSLQLGLSTKLASFDGLPGAHSRSISWKSESEPLYNIVSPQAAFDRLTGAGPAMPSLPGNMMTDPIAERRRLLKKSALDYIIESSTSLGARLSRSDKVRIDKFITSVRTLETRVSSSSMPGGGGISGPVGGMCKQLARPSYTAGIDGVPAGYNRGEHATLMIDLMVMAIQCDATRVVSFMLDDARSEWVYNFIPKRAFTATGSTPTTQTVGNYHGAQHGNAEEFASIIHWNAQKVNEMATKLDALKEGGVSVLDNTVLVMMSGMNGGNHDGLDLPILWVGSGSGVLRTNQYIDGGKKNLADLHLTMINKVYGGTLPAFGVPNGNYTHGTMINEILV
jgi:hypothetical protein